MPKLACRACGRQIYTVAPLDSLFAEERRCPRCGAFLDADRREAERRQQIRRMNPPDDPGPPDPPGVERRGAERRVRRRRQAEGG
jgi:ribosomal protein S27AE